MILSLNLPKKRKKKTDLTDPYIQKLIFELNSVARVSLSENTNAPEHYTVKDVAELFDVNKQTVYKWIAEEKIEYKIDESPGKIQRKGYQIPKGQFKTEKEMHAVDPTFRDRREKNMREIPNTGSYQPDMPPQEGNGNSVSYDDIKAKINRNNQ